MSPKKKQRRGRRQTPKELSNQAWFSLFKYWERVELLNDTTVQMVHTLYSGYGTNFDENRKAVMESHIHIFFELWHGSLEVVVEAYNKYGLYDESIETLLDLPMRDKLDILRNGTFHFREDYYDKKVLSIFETEGAYDWIKSLSQSMHNFLLREAEMLDSKLGISPKSFSDLQKEGKHMERDVINVMNKGFGLPRNSLCFCGSNKRYKHCHGRSISL